ncbi:hypothetical protein [Nocardia sp. CA-120079]|uniref:hypothetical protein n=1 Tax=Nocardia sp. CA-120079 TaxID=3239974 RepID=UPI003D98D49B
MDSTAATGKAGKVDAPGRDELIAAIATQFDQLVSTARAERPRRHGEDADWLDRVIGELESIAEQAHDLVVFRVIFDVVQRHGTGPYPAADLAIFADADLVEVRRVMASLVAQGLATPDTRDDGGDGRRRGNTQ